MKNCRQIVAEIKSGEDGVREAFRKMYQYDGFQKIVYSIYQKYRVVRNLLKWEDLLTESIIRFVEKAQAGTNIRNCNAYFYGICNNYCRELTRQSAKEGKVTKEEDKTDQLFQAVRPYVDRLSAQCRLLLLLVYFNHPPLDPKKRQELANILETNGYTVQPQVIPTLISRCKRKLRELIGSDLDDFDL